MSGLEAFPYDVQKYVGIPFDDDGEYDSCSMYDINYENFTNEEIYNWNRTQLDNATTRECSSWVFDQSEFVTTINSEVHGDASHVGFHLLTNGLPLN